MKTYNLEFKGFYLDCRKNTALPQDSGIYCVYSCEYNKGKNTVGNLKLLYIGESDNINKRHKDNAHEHYEDFLNYLDKDETLCYSYVLIGNEDDRKRCEAALIYEMNPPINEQSTVSYSYPETHLIISGKTNCLTENFTIS